MAFGASLDDPPLALSKAKRARDLVVGMVISHDHEGSQGESRGGVPTPASHAKWHFCSAQEQQTDEHSRTAIEIPVSVTRRAGEPTETSGRAATLAASHQTSLTHLSPGAP
jgi:hypothetical protein